MAFLAIMYVAVGLALDVVDATAAPTLEAAELGLTVIFASEFASRFAASRNRVRYLRGHWIDLIALVPAVRGLRVARLLRLLRLVRTFAGLYRALGHVGRLADHRGLQSVVVAWLAVMVICCAALYLAERDVNEAVKSPFDALWWGVSTMTTVGYGDVYPLTPEGRVAATVLMVLGIGLFSAVTAIVTSYLLQGRRGEDGDPIDSIERLGRLAREGTVTAEEFAQKRGELLARI
jgi:voltage-gated potassium channel